ncbi:MAG: response regulator [Verrucomicrobia bacterium]|nr:response regulator [Verrucomicrobiota bacterium]
MKTILFVDDDLFVTTLYRTKLAGEGYRVETANGGEQALSMLETLRPDTIILDLNMPGLSGVDVLKKIRAISELKDVPVIIFSNGHMQKLLDEVCPLGVQKFFTKSQCPPNRLLSEIKNTMESLELSAAGIPLPTALEAAANSIQPGSGPEVPPIGAHPEVQRKALARLYRKVQTDMQEALAGETGSRRELLGRAVKGLFEDLYEHPEHISATSVETLTRGIGNLNKAETAPFRPVLDSEAALKGMLQAFEE